jgi:AcrR family transcriptional regulator
VALGRPREFDTDLALDRALEVFRRTGYEGASIADLTGAMGINAPSLYAAFGNKEALFRKALGRYTEKLRYWNEALAEPTARRVVEHLLYSTADFMTDECGPRGCLFVRGALSCGDSTESIRAELDARRVAAEAGLCERFERAKAGGELRDCDPGDLARYVMTVLEGITLRAVGGGRREELRKVADMALRAWPS